MGAKLITCATWSANVWDGQSLATARNVMAQGEYAGNPALRATVWAG